VNFIGVKIIEKWWLREKNEIYLQIEAVAKPKRKSGVWSKSSTPGTTMTLILPLYEIHIDLLLL